MVPTRHRDGATFQLSSTGALTVHFAPFIKTLTRAITPVVEFFRLVSLNADPNACGRSLTSLDAPRIAL